MFCGNGPACGMCEVEEIDRVRQSHFKSLVLNLCVGCGLPWPCWKIRNMEKR